MKETTSIFAMLIVLSSFGQITLDKALILDGSHTVVGLSAPTAADQALSAAALQAAGYMYCYATGTNSLNGTLVPAPDTLLAGMNVHVGLANLNTGPMTLDLNGFGSMPILKEGSLQLDSADVLPGMIVQLIFDGVAFHLINGRERNRRPCPPGFIEINSQYCIEQNERPAVDFPDAAETCGNLGGKICSWAEFYYACERDTVFGLNNMSGDYEWTNTMANADDNVRVAGWNNCRSAGTTVTISATPRKFRCCYRR